MTYGRLIHRSRSDSTARRLPYEEARQRVIAGDSVSYGPHGRYRSSYKIGLDYINARQFSRLKKDLALVQTNKMRREHWADEPLSHNGDRL